MSSITVANIEWEIIDDLRVALAQATIGVVSVFPNVGITTTVQQAKDWSFKNDEPRAFVLFQGQVEDHSLEDQRNVIVDTAIFLYARVTTALTTDSKSAEKLKEILRLMNAAKNAIETSPPADSTACADSNVYNNRLEWGSPDIDLDTDDPWTALTLPLTVSFGLDSPTDH